jgi:hypothetical protein
MMTDMASVIPKAPIIRVLPCRRKRVDRAALDLRKMRENPSLPSFVKVAALPASVKLTAACV